VSSLTNGNQTGWFKDNLWTGPAGVPVGLSRDLCGVSYTSPANGNSYIYTIGGVYYDSTTKVNGQNHGATTNKVWYAQIKSTGGLAVWKPTASLPVSPGLQLHGSVVLTVGTNTYLYVIGGST